MLQALAKALLIIFGYPLLPKNLVVADPTSFQERLEMKRKENIIWLIVWYCVTSLFLWLFGKDIDYILVTTAFVFLGIFCIEPKAILLFFLATLILKPMLALKIVGVVVGYLVFFWLLVQLSYEPESHS
jgi:hypothetical protein